MHVQLAGDHVRGRCCQIECVGVNYMVDETGPDPTIDYSGFQDDLAILHLQVSEVTRACVFVTLLVRIIAVYSRREVRSRCLPLPSTVI